MRIAIVSDIHGNRTAFEAVLADLRETSPDLVLHGGDLADVGASPADVVDRIRDLGWPGVLGNTDQMLVSRESLKQFADQSPHAFQPLFAFVGEMAEATREALGNERIEWLRSLPRSHVCHPIALVHASPGDLWRAPTPEASDAELESVYGPLGQPIAVYGHIHRSFIRRVSATIVANSGSVGLSYDGDRRAAYLLLDEGVPSIRRVEYDVEAESSLLAGSGLPYSGWVAHMLRTGRFQMPQ
jgi:putative phosphoesterase